MLLPSRIETKLSPSKLSGAAMPPSSIQVATISIMTQGPWWIFRMSLTDNAVIAAGQCAIKGVEIPPSWTQDLKSLKGEFDALLHGKS